MAKEMASFGSGWLRERSGEREKRDLCMSVSEERSAISIFTTMDRLLEPSTRLPSRFESQMDPMGGRVKLYAAVGSSFLASVSSLDTLAAIAHFEFLSLNFNSLHQAHSNLKRRPKCVRVCICA